MNERIDEIAFEAGCYRHKYWDPKHLDLDGFIISQADLDKFAELIVRKCAELMYGRDENGNCKDGDVIKEHFGAKV